MAICHHVVLVANYILTFLEPFCKVMFPSCQQNTPEMQARIQDFEMGGEFL